MHDINCPFPNCGIGFLLDDDDEVYPDHTPGGETELVDSLGLCPTSGINFVGNILIVPEELSTDLVESDEGIDQFLADLLEHMAKPVEPCRLCGGIQHEQNCFARTHMITWFGAPPVSEGQS